MANVVGYWIASEMKVLSELSKDIPIKWANQKTISVTKYGYNSSEMSSNFRDITGLCRRD